MAPALLETAPPWQDPDAFRALARAELSARFGTPLAARRIAGFPRAFDLVSEDATLVGAILPPSRRGSRSLTTLERAELSEHVLMLTCAPAQQRILVVAEPRARLDPWLAVYGHLARDIEIWRLRGPGLLDPIA